MTLYLIGIGLNDEKDISLKGLEIVKNCDVIYLENYTSRLNCDIKDLEKLYGKKIILADRSLVEKKAEETILKEAKNKETAFLVIGDIFGATTHVDLMLRAKKENINVNIIHNTSILTAIGITKSIFKKLFSYQNKIFNFLFISNHIRGIQLSNYNFSLRNLKLFTITSLFRFSVI